MNGAEYGVIGSILIEPSCLAGVRGVLTESCFRTEQGRLFFRTVCRMADDGKPIDPVTVLASGLSEEWLAQIVETTPSAANVMYYAEQLKREAQIYALRAMLSDLTSKAEEGDAEPAAIIASAQEALETIGTEKTGSLVDSIEASEHFSEHLLRMKNGETIVVPTYFPSIDSILGGGMVKSGLYIVAARPGTGKTAFGLIVAELAAKHHQILFVSLEMSEIQITARRYANLSGLRAIDLLYGRTEPGDGQKLEKAAMAIGESRLSYAGSNTATVADIGVMARSCGADLVVIDYLGLIQSDQRNLSSYERVTRISGDLKRLARSLNIPIMCLAQLNRTSESRADKRPSMSDLRDSGAIEQDADGILLLHRPAVYDKEEPKDYEAQAFEIQIAKNRHGPTGKVVLTWYARNGRFQDEKGKMNSWQ